MGSVCLMVLEATGSKASGAPSISWPAVQFQGLLVCTGILAMTLCLPICPDPRFFIAPVTLGLDLPRGSRFKLYLSKGPVSRSVHILSYLGWDPLQDIFWGAL